MTICGRERAYTPGMFFNSAKFLDLEYQTYGDIPAQLPDHIGTLYWEHAGGRKSIRINYEKATGIVTGFNLMGIRYRHEVCDVWLQEQRNLQYVMQHLRAANFDPEFFDRHEKDVVGLYNRQFPQQPVKLRSSRSLVKMIFGSRRKHGPAVDLSAPSSNSPKS